MTEPRVEEPRTGEDAPRKRRLGLAEQVLLGLGLGIARRLLADLGGNLEYKPSKDTGACFSITLPAESEPT